MSDKILSRLPQSFGASGLFRLNPDPRVQRPLPCRCCYERPTVYSFCDETGRKTSDAGLCANCARPQTPTDDDLMLVEVATFADRHPVHFTPATLDTIEANAREYEDYKVTANADWKQARALRAELHELRDWSNWMQKTFPNAKPGGALTERLDYIEREYPFLDDPIFGPGEAAPYPEALPFA